MFVIDSTEKTLLEEAKDEFFEILQNENVEDAKLLIMLNKQDLEGAMSFEDVYNYLELSKLKEREFHMQPCSALTGEGLFSGLEWLANKMQNDKKQFPINPYATSVFLTRLRSCKRNEKQCRRKRTRTKNGGNSIN